jgi:hypothetical protein
MTLLFRCAALIGLLTLTAAAPAQFPLETLLKNADAARTFDYWRLRDGRDAVAIDALRKDVHAAMKLENVEEPERCFSDAEVEVLNGLLGVVTANSPTQWRQHRDAAASTLQKFDQALAALLEGTPTGDTDLDQSIPPYIARAKAAKSARGRELALRTARDQAMRKGWESDFLLGRLDPSARSLVNLSLWNRACRVDADNVAWIKGEVRARGWFEISRYGADAEKDAWLLVQHADHDNALQSEVLGVLDKLRLKGETNPKSFAYLYDRVAINAGRPQRYGTQGGCKDGERFTSPLENPDTVDRSRAEVGMTSLAEYNALFRCRKPDS